MEDVSSILILRQEVPPADVVWSSFILPLTYTTWYTIYWLVCCRMSMLCFLAPHRLVVTLTKDALKSAICWLKYPVCQKMIAKKYCMLLWGNGGLKGYVLISVSINLTLLFI